MKFDATSMFIFSNSGENNFCLTHQIFCSMSWLVTEMAKQLLYHAFLLLKCQYWWCVHYLLPAFSSSFVSCYRNIDIGKYQAIIVQYIVSNVREYFVVYYTQYIELINTNLLIKKHFCKLQLICFCNQNCKIPGKNFIF